MFPDPHSPVGPESVQLPVPREPHSQGLGGGGGGGCRTLPLTSGV